MSTRFHLIRANLALIVVSGCETSSNETSSSLTPSGIWQRKANISTSSRRHGMDFPPALSFRPTTSSIGPVGVCSPGIHLGKNSVNGPGLTGIFRVERRMFLEASVASTCNDIVCPDVVPMKLTINRSAEERHSDSLVLLINIIPILYLTFRQSSLFRRFVAPDERDGGQFGAC